MKFGDYLRDQRNEKGWTQPEAAEQRGIEQSYLSKLENGKAYPSEEVFEKLRSAYGLDLDAICEQVSDPELQKMREVSSIRATLNGRARKGLRAYRGAMLLGAFLIVLGSGLLAHWGWVSHTVRPVVYIYESKGAVLEGESPYLFNRMPSSRELAHMSGQHFEKYFLDEKQIARQFELGRLNDIDRDMYLQRLALQARLDFDQQSIGAHRGDMFIEQVQGGSRTYTLVDERGKYRPQDTAAFFIFGIMGIVAGIMSFIVGARWR